MRKSRGWLLFLCLVCRAFALFSPAVNCSVASLSMCSRNRGRNEGPSSGKDCFPVFDTPHSKSAASNQQRNSISILTIGTSLHLGEDRRTPGICTDAEELRLVQLFKYGFRLAEPFQDELFFRGGIPVRVLRSDLDRPVNPRRKIFGILSGVGAFSGDGEVYRTCRCIAVVVHHGIFGLFAPRAEDAPPAFLQRQRAAEIRRFFCRVSWQRF